MTELPADWQPRSHPQMVSWLAHIILCSADMQTRPVLYVSHVPNHLRNDDLAGTIHECGQFTINIFEPIPPKERLLPDQYYEWMPRAGESGG